MSKKVISLFFAFCIVCVFFVPVFAYAEEETSTMAEEETIICTIPDGAQYELGKVLVVFKKSATIINKVHTPESFGDVGVISVEDLSYITNAEARKWVDENNYHQILALTLSNETEQGAV